MTDHTPRPSITALFSAFTRAYHAAHDHPKIFDDSLAAALLGPDEMARFEENLSRGLPFFAPESIPFARDPKDALAIVMRSIGTAITLGRARYTEDRLAAAMQDGVTQYVILGAGLDTFAFRRPDVLGRLQVVELDHPATQEDKLARIARAGWALPGGLHFAPIDFARDDLESVLRRSAFDPARPTLFSWLGVTYYLTRAAVLGTLRSLASLASPREETPDRVVFDYLDPDAFDEERAALRTRRMVAATRTTEEPMQTALSPDTLAAELRDVGLELVEQLGPREIQEAFFDGRADGQTAFEHVHFATAVARASALPG